MIKFSYLFGISLLIISCNREVVEQVTNPDDYNKYLDTSIRPTYEAADNEVKFWSKRLRTDSSGVGDLGPLAGAYARLFETTGDTENLKNAEALYKKGMEISANNKDIYARSIAHTFISQHRFKEAEALLKETYNDSGSRKKPTELMLFDVMMELGNYEDAEFYLDKIRNTSDYNYLIRKAKWSDHIGDLDEAIKYMEDAKVIAESRNSKGLKIWTYSNLADFYGHAGRVGEAYEHYLKTLELQPDNAYVKKGIAWIAYANELDVSEARRILDSIMINQKVPEYYLLLSEFAEFESDEAEAKKQLAAFFSAIENGDYGAMYNTYLIEALAEEEPQKALELAETEVDNRATPETYQLLAYAHLMAGNKKRALEIIEGRVRDKTFEPMAQYHEAMIYKANGMNKEVERLKKELLNASFELGPVLTDKIKSL